MAVRLRWTPWIREPSMEFRSLRWNSGEGFEYYTTLVEEALHFSHPSMKKTIIIVDTKHLVSKTKNFALVTRTQLLSMRCDTIIHLW